MNKKIIFCAVFLALFVFAQKSLAATLTASPASGNQAVGDIFYVRVLLDTQSMATDGVDLHYLKFNNNLIKLNSVTLGTLFTTTMTNTIDNVGGTYNFSQVTTGGVSYTGKGNLLTLTFQALSAGTAAITFDYTAGATTDCNISSSGSDVLNQVAGASFTITTNQLPIATASANPTSGLAPLTVQFTGSANDPDGIIASYNWNFGDNTANSSLQNPSHTYATTGNYIAVLTVKDNKGGSDSKSISISATSLNNQLPIATASANPTSGLAPLTVQFTGSANDPDGTIVYYNWNFGDNTANSSLQNPSHTFASAGTYFVYLTATDNKGANDSKLVIITATAPTTTNQSENNIGEITTKPLNQMSIEELKAELARITALIAQLQAQLLALSGGNSGIPHGFTFSKIMKLGTISNDVKYLQIILNSDPATLVAVSGKGSWGKENTYFGQLTKSAVIKFQEKYKSEILTPAGLSKGTGNVSLRTIKKLNQLLLKK